MSLVPSYRRGRLGIECLFQHHAAGRLADQALGGLKALAWRQLHGRAADVDREIAINSKWEHCGTHP